MSRLDELPPDQRAALSLLLRQRKRYAEVAAMLAIPEQSVRARAHAALAVLAPRQARELTPERRQQIGDYLLGQDGVAERLATRTFLDESEPGRAWALAVSAELAALAGGALPDIPAGPAPASAPPAPAPGARPVSGGAPSLAQQAASAGPGTAAPAPGALPSSRLGGALLLAAIVVAVVVAVVLLTTGGGSSKPKRSAATTTAKTTSTSTSATTPTVTQRIAMHSPDPRSRSVGAVEVVREGGKLAFVIEAEHLSPSHDFYYAIWLYNSPTSALPLSKSPPVGSNERLEGAAALPGNAGEYKEILLTRETSEHPTHPGKVILEGAFSVGSG